MIRISVLYPAGEGKKFDYDYYKNKHMILVAERLKPFGLIRTAVDRGIAGGARFAFKSFDELAGLVGDLSEEEKRSMEVDPYTEEQFYDDLMRVTEDCADPDLAMQLVRESQPTVRWMRDRGVRWIPMFGRQAYKVRGRFRVWGGLVLGAGGGGAGVTRTGYAAAAKAGIAVRFEAECGPPRTHHRRA